MENKKEQFDQKRYNESVQEMAAALRTIRQSSGWRLHRLALAMKCSHSRISKIERGFIMPTAQYINDLCRILELPSDKRMDLQDMFQDYLLRINQIKLKLKHLDEEEDESESQHSA